MNSPPTDDPPEPDRVPRIQPVDWESPDGRALRDSLRHEPVAAVIPHLRTTFLMKSMEAPGACFAGALVAHPTAGPPPVSVSGRGMTLPDALLSLLGEAAERWSLLAASADPRPSSIGVAAGRTLAEAELRAVLEGLERHAVAQWWDGDSPAAALPLDTPGMAAAIATLERLRGGATLRRTWLIDVSRPGPVVTVMALSRQPDGSGLCAGAAARMTVGAAATAALLELAQMELGLAFAREKARQLGEAALTDDDRRHLARAGLFDTGIARCPPLSAVGPPRTPPAEDDGASAMSARDLVEAVAPPGWPVTFEDLTHPALGVPVARATLPPPERPRAAPGVPPNPFANLSLL